MNALAPAFANLHNFLHFVVLENFVEYSQARELDPADVTRRKEHRLFFNAVVAFDSAIDHAQVYAGWEGSTQTFLAHLTKKVPALSRIRDFAVALKHCEPSSSGRPKAVELATTTLHISITPAYPADGPRLHATSEMIADANEVLKAAWHFWFDAAQKIELGENPF